MAIRNRGLAWLQASVSLVALAGVAILMPATNAHADDPIDQTTPVVTASASPSASPSASTPGFPRSGTSSQTTQPTQTTAAPAPETKASEPVATPQPPSTTTGAALIGKYQVTGEFLTFYQAKGAERGVLGLPIGDQRAGKDGGLIQDFEHGTLWYSSRTGVAMTQNGFHGFYASKGFEKGVLGYPKGVERAARGGTLQEFEGGMLWWSEKTGVAMTQGRFQQFYAAYSFERGALGFPKGSERAAQGGLVQEFEGGMLWWSPKTGVAMTRAGFQGLYAAYGYERGALGFPKGTERGASGGAVQEFEGGMMWYSARTGIALTRAGFQGLYAAYGYERGTMGFPIGGERPAKDGGASQQFEGGTVFYSPSTGIHMTRAGFNGMYAARGYEWGWLGYPTSDEYAINGGAAQEFQGGTMYYDAVGMTATPGTKALQWGYTQIGKPYSMGATGPGAYDCSGFTQAAFAAAGFSIPRTSYSQPAAGVPVPYNSLRPGDLVFSYGYGHVAIYVGNGQVINALTYGTPLGITPLYGGFNGAVRVIG